MRRKPGTLPDPESHTIRLAWWASFFATIAVIAILGAVRSAQASIVPGGGPIGALAPLAFASTEEDEELEEEELEFEECLEEEGEAECEKRIGVGGAGEGAEGCVLRSASATVSVLKNEDRVRLTIRYTTFSPAVVSVQYRLRGHRGTLRMGTDSHRFSRRGVFRDTEKLNEAEMTRVNAATEFDVSVHAVNAPRYCRGRFDRDLTAHHTAPSGPVWTD